jgi:hypothetical protein
MMIFDDYYQSSPCSDDGMPEENLPPPLMHLIFIIVASLQSATPTPLLAEHV